ncbi:MAG TPA: MerR family transcriptional regulator [Flavobacteriales bacterium]
MEPFPDKFSITDLESFSGVKAHTIRAWERRYAILKPGRRGANVRSYNNDELRNLMNVALLVRHGIKISKVAQLSLKEREIRVRQLAEGDAGVEHDLQRLQIAMLGYDSGMLERIANDFEEREGFQGLMEKLFLPFLIRIGTLWQSDAIRAGQEHMASNLIRQRIIAAIHALPSHPREESPLCVLFLPEQELHELGLLYLNYLLRLQDHRTLFLGQSVPYGDLRGIALRTSDPVIFIGVYSTVPRSEPMADHIAKLRATIPQGHARFILSGPRVAEVEKMELPSGVMVHTDIREIPRLVGSMKGFDRTI